MVNSWYWHAIRKLREHAQYNSGRYLIGASTARWVLGQRLRVPRSLQPVVLCDLVDLGLLSRNGKDSFVVSFVEDGDGVLIL